MEYIAYTIKGLEEIVKDEILGNVNELVQKMYNEIYVSTETNTIRVTDQKTFKGMCVWNNNALS